MELRYGMFLMLSSLSLYADGFLDEQEKGEERSELISPDTSIELKEPSYQIAVSSQAPSNLPQEQKTTLHNFPQRVQIGGNYSYARVKPKGNHSTKGSLGGVFAIYEYRPQDYVYAAAVFSWRAGMTKHSATHRKIQDFNGQERIGYTFGKKRIGDNRLTLFTGVGIRYLNEKVRVHSASLELAYTEFYVPLGFLFENRVNSIFSWGCNFQWMPQVFPLVRLEPLNGAQWSLKYKLSNFLVEVPLTFNVYSDRLAIIVSPFFETWHDGRTTAKTKTGLVLGLPSNSYIFTGVNVSLGVSF